MSLAAEPDHPDVGAHESRAQIGVPSAAVSHDDSLFTRLFDLSSDGLSIRRLDDGRVIQVNDSFLRMLGYSREEVIGRTADELGLWAEGDHRDAVVRPLRGRQSVGGLELRLRSKSGEERVIESSAQLIELGGTMCVLTIDRDVTERRRSEAKLQLAAERLRILHQIDRDILAARSTKETVSAALSRIRDLLPCSRATVALIDDVGRAAVMFAVNVNGETRFDEGARVPFPDFRPVLERARGGEIFLLDDLAAVKVEALPQALQGLRAEGIRTFASVPLAVREQLTGLLSLGSATPQAFDADHLQIALEIGAQLAIAVQHARIWEADQEHMLRLRAALGDLRASEVHRVELLRQLIGAQEAERRRIAADVHDDAVQSVTAAAMRLDMFSASHPEAAGDPNLLKLSESVHLTISRLRSLIFELHPKALETQGLAAAIREYVDRQFDGTDTRHMIVNDLIDEPAADARIVLYRVAQEAIANVRKHANASEVAITLTGDEAGYTVVVQDDGDGMEAEHAPEPGHLGMASMRERSQAAGGWLKAQSAAGEGMRIQCWIPKPSSESDESDDNDVSDVSDVADGSDGPA